MPGLRAVAHDPGAGVRVACHAMRTRFELLLQGDRPERLRAAGEEAIAVIAAAEARLSRFRPSSELSRVNARAAREPVPVTPELFALLERAAQLHAVTGGAFDVTVTPLMHCWRFGDGTGVVPSPAELARALACVGMDRVQLDERRRTVRFTTAGVQLDLGGIGKGWALEEAARTLRELGVGHALLHGGTSSVYGIGTPLEGGAWRIAIEGPPGSGCAGAPLGIVSLRDAALGVSAVCGRGFREDGVCYGHVLDPRTGRPVRGALLAAVACAEATDADALATALLVLGTGGAGPLVETRPGLAALVLGGEEGDTQVWRRGITMEHEAA